MPLELNSEEIRFFNQLLERHLVNLLQEIAHTDSREFKKDLQSEYDFGSALKNKLAPHLSARRSA